MIRSILKILMLSGFFACILLQQFTYAQHTVKIEITQRPDKHAEEPVFIVGNFNNWALAQAAYQMRKNGDGRYAIELKAIKGGLLDFKFNRGNWQTLECTAEGRLMQSRQLTIRSDTVVAVAIHDWRDDHPASTASPQAHLLDSAFFMPQLNAYRGTRIYLPKNYEHSFKRYPVLYMHDGQHLFDEASAAGRLGPVEWGVDETIDHSGKDCIVVGIDHAADKNRRIREYLVHPNTQYDTAYGADYLRFIAQTLKPYIDKHYRTLPGKETTFMAGSSMGGLLTLYGGLLHPEVFGALGVFSPSIWLDEGNIYKTVAAINNGEPYKTQRYYFYGGGNENRMKPDGSFVAMANDIGLTIGVLQQQIGPEIKSSVNPEGRHGQWYWKLAFPDFYQWLIPDQQRR